MDKNIFKEKVSLYSLAKWTNGLAYKDIHFSSKGVPIIKIAELKNGITAQTNYTNGIFSDSLKLHYDDLLFSWSGNPDTSIDIFRYRLENGWLNQHIFKVEPFINKDYFYYLMKSLKPTFVHMASNKQTTGLGHVTISDLKRLEVRLHNESEQQHIVDILGTLDDKIENNDKIIKEISYLIQLKFENLIRKNKTEEKLLTDIFSFQEGPGIRNWQYVDKGINFINIRCINNGDIDTSSMNKISDDEAVGIYKHFLLKEWDLVMSMSGTLGRYAIVRKEHLPLCLNTSVIRFYPKDDFSYFSYMYAYLTSENFITSITLLANGSAQQNVGPTHLKKIRINVPTSETIQDFHQKVFPLIQRIISLRSDNQKINELKNLYLKKFFG